MSQNNSQGSYYTGSFSEPDTTWHPGDPNFLQQAGDPTVTTSYTMPAYHTTQDHATSTFEAFNETNIDYDTQAIYNPTYAPATSGWQSASLTAPIGDPSHYFTPPSSDPIEYSPITSGGLDLSVYPHSSEAWEDPHTPKDQSPGYGSISQGSGKKTGFRCPYCTDKMYSRSRDLQRHLHARHPQAKSASGESSEFVDCQYCDKKQMRKDNLKRHMEKKHPRFRDTSNIAPRR